MKCYCGHKIRGQNHKECKHHKTGKTNPFAVGNTPHSTARYNAVGV